MGRKKPLNFGKNVSIRQKGKSFEERFGEEKAKLIKQKLSKNASKSWSEKFNSDKVNEMKTNAKKRMEEYNKDRVWTKEKIINSVKKYIKDNLYIKKNDFWKPVGKPIPSARIIEKHFGSLDTMALEIGFSFHKHNRKEYLKNNPDVVKKIINNNKNFQKGNKYEDRYDDNTNNNIKEQLRNNMLKRFETEEVWNKGLTGVQDAWNKNLTKDDHEGIRKMSKARILYMQKNKGNFISTHEKIIHKFLEENNIEYESQYYVKDIKNKYLADIYLINKNIIIEVDGIYWHTQEGRKELDEKRTNQMIEKGYKVLRFTDKIINDNIEYVKNKILLTIKNA